MEHFTPTQAKVDEFIRFVCGRPATEEELEATERPQFRFAYFRIQLLSGEECLSRWPDIVSAWSRFAASEREISESTHKMAHDLSLLRRDLEKVQANFDGLQPKVLEVLRSAEAIARFAEAMKDIQVELLGFNARIAALDHKLSNYLAEEAE